ncbi:MAG: Spore germination protein B1 [Pelotomaculum sp. PtaB.Bin104]|nr:MAG: Spore germination protein B1 [Pelotomaculum sp. PtaB.Bin104]
MLIKSLARTLKKLMKRKPADNIKSRHIEERVFCSEELKKIKVTSRLHENLAVLKNILGQNKDVIFHSFKLGQTQAEAAIVYIEGMVDLDLLNNHVIKPLISEISQSGDKRAVGVCLPELLTGSILQVSNVHGVRVIDDVIAGILYGQVILLVNSLEQAWVFDLKKWDMRNITEPEAEVVVRGPREGFTETIATNTTLLRRKLRSPNLMFEPLSIGRVTATEVRVFYIKGLASPELVYEVMSRLRRIDIDGILESGYLEELIEDSPYSPFPQLIHTERPDRVAASLLEGRVAILTDGTPFALIVPAQLTAFLTAPEDYYERYFIGTAVLWVRYISVIASLLLPSLYIAVTTFHQEMIPTRLLISISSYRQGVPFSALVEALLLEFVFEVLREAGTRLPRQVGQAVSVAGALVIGQAGVMAGLVSPLMVILVASNGLASFANPSYNLGISMRLLRFPLMLLAGTLGLVGVTFGVLMITIHLASLRSFGLPYLSALAPLHTGDLKDVLVRAPWWAMGYRPVDIARHNRRRQVAGLKPAPPGPGRRKEGR